MNMYRVGFCPVCDKQIMVSDQFGRYVTLKTNYRQVDLVFEDGHRCRSIICKDCLNVEPNKLLEIITAQDSLASSRENLDALKKRVPVKLEEVRRGR